MSRGILIITNGHLCRNPRVVKEATTLGHAGYAVTVLGIRNHAPSIAIDAELMREAPFRHDAVVASSRVRRFRTRIAREAVRRLGWQTLHALGPFDALLERARATPADLTIVHNEVAHAVGVRLMRERRRVAADLEDWHSEDLLPSDRAHRPLRLLRETEAAVIRTAAHTTTTSHALADALHARYGGTRPHVLTNSFPLEPSPLLHATRDVPTFFWFSQTVGPGRGLEAFFMAWSRTRFPSRIVVLGEITAGYRAQLLALAPPDRRTAIQFLPLVPPSRLPTLIAEHDIGLALEDTAIPSRDLTITNKILQYLNAGLAVVASNTTGQREVLAHSPEAGVLVDLANVAACAAALDALLADRMGLVRRQRAARHLAEDVYCWEREAPRLLALVEVALAERPARTVS